MSLLRNLSGVEAYYPAHDVVLFLLHYGILIKSSKWCLLATIKIGWMRKGCDFLEIATKCAIRCLNSRRKLSIRLHLCPCNFMTMRHDLRRWRPRLPPVFLSSLGAKSSSWSFTCTPGWPQWQTTWEFFLMLWVCGRERAGKELTMAYTCLSWNLNGCGG